MGVSFPFERGTSASADQDHPDIVAHAPEVAQGLVARADCGTSRSHVRRGRGVM
jgi:hypothetical protein